MKSSEWILILIMSGNNPGPPAIVPGYASAALCQAAGQYARDNPRTRDLDQKQRRAYWEIIHRQGGDPGWSPIIGAFECVPR